MTKTVEEKLLRGGSLNRTTLRLLDDGRRVVRKSVSRTANREYGFVRWYSQFKRLQRFNRLFPDLFPRLVSAGVNENGAYFDLEFIADSIDVKQYLSTDISVSAIHRLHAQLWAAMDRLHDYASFDSFPGSLELYFEEEIAQRLSDAMRHPQFREFCLREYIIIDDEKCEGLLTSMDWLRQTFSRLRIDRECYTHGNVTLENILYVPSTERVVFIDPYEENVIDCREAEYSQILQCSNQLYGYINDRTVRVSGAEVAFEGEIPQAFRVFNDLFLNMLTSRLSEERLLIVRLLEASQFTRMLPFKVLAGHVGKAMYFYGVACRLVQSIRREFGS